MAEMIVTVERLIYTDLSTCGEMMLDGVFECYTLEPRADRTKGKPFCIPGGKYDVVLGLSKRFGVKVPKVLNVPNFTDIEIHIGNFITNTHGCALVGTYHSLDYVGSSLIAFNKLMTKLPERFTIEYINHEYQH